MLPFFIKVITSLFFMLYDNETGKEFAINISESTFNSSIKFLMDKGFSINNSLPLTVIFIIKSILWLIIKVKKSKKA